MQYSSAASKADAVARMYHLGGARIEILGPGSKEKRSALEALAGVVHVDLSDVSSKTECGRHLAGVLRVPWDEACYSAGDTITLVGLNRLVDGVVEVLVQNDPSIEGALVAELMRLRPAPRAGHWRAEGLHMETVSTETKENIAEFIAQLSADGPAPVGVVFTPASLTPEEVRFDDSSWREHLGAVQGWLCLSADLNRESAGAFDASLANELGLSEAEVDHGALADKLLERLERALELRVQFEEALEDEAEGGETLGSATQRWLDAWAEIEDEDESEGSGPIKAAAATWPISEFVQYASDNELELSPSYQRADVWPTADAQQLIESVLRGIPLPSVILLQRSDEQGTTYEVVDGKQRLTSILRFTGSHPAAVALVREKAREWGEPEAEDLFQDDYPAFKKLWKKYEPETLTTQVERRLYFPFALRKGDVKPLSGDLEPLRGKYYSQIRKETITVVGEKRRVQSLFEQQSRYKLPVIVYEEVTSTQVHEVFSLYNKQGKHLNAEEIRNARYHQLPLMRALLATAGDSGDVNDVAPFLAPHWDDLSSTAEVLDGYGFGKAGYKRTKLLSWVAASLFVQDGSPIARSTASQINTLFDTLQADKLHRLNSPDAVLDAMLLLDHAVDAHASIPDECWSPRFKAQAKWQELQLVGTLVGLTAARAVYEERLESVVEARLESISRATASDEWRRPAKTQSKQQWMHTGRVASGMLDILEVDPTVAARELEARFGQTGLIQLLSLASLPHR